MTICISVRVAEGLVLAADSTTILMDESERIVQTFDFVTKVAQVGDYPMAVMTWGIGSLSSRSIQSLVMEFEFDYQAASPFRVADVARDLLVFLTERYDAAFPQPTVRQTLGLYVGGYDDRSFFSTALWCQLPVQRDWLPVRPDKADGNPDFGINWYGAPDALQRLFLGYDPAAIEKLIARGVDRSTVQAWLDSGEASLPILFDAMPVQDAIDLAEWCALVTIGRYRFGAGIAVVGGDVDIAVIRPRSFQWAQRKRWSIKEDEHGPGPLAIRSRDSSDAKPSDKHLGQPAAVATPGPRARPQRAPSRGSPRPRRTRGT